MTPRRITQRIMCSLHNAPYLVGKQTVDQGRPTTMVFGGRGRGTRKTGGDYSPIHLYTSPPPTPLFY